MGHCPCIPGLAAGAIALTLATRACLLSGLKLRLIGHLAAHPCAGSHATHAHSHSVSHTHAPHTHSHASSHTHTAALGLSHTLLGSHSGARALPHLHPLDESLSKDRQSAIAKPFPNHWRNIAESLRIALGAVEFGRPQVAVRLPRVRRLGGSVDPSSGLHRVRRPSGRVPFPCPYPCHGRVPVGPRPRRGQYDTYG